MTAPALLLWLWMLVSPDLTVHRVDGPVQFTDLYGSIGYARGFSVIQRDMRRAGAYRSNSGKPVD